MGRGGRQQGRAAQPLRERSEDLDEGIAAAATDGGGPPHMGAAAGGGRRPPSSDQRNISISDRDLRTLWDSLEEAGLDSGDHAEFVAAEEYAEEFSDLWQAEMEFHRRHGIEEMLSGIQEEDLPPATREVLDRGRALLRKAGISTEGLSPQAVFQMWRFWDTWNRPRSWGYSEQVLRGSVDAQRLSLRAANSGNMEDIRSATLFLEAAQAGAHSEHYRQLDKEISKVDGEIRDRLATEGARPDGLLLAVPSSRWVLSGESYYLSGGSAVAQNSFNGRRDTFDQMEVSSLYMEDIREGILYGSEDEEIYDMDTGELRQELLDRPLPEEALRERVEHVGQHELIHDMQIPTDYTGMPDEEVAELAGLTEGITEELNVRKLEEIGREVGETAYHHQRAGIALVLEKAQVPESEQMALLERINLLPREESRRVLNGLLREAGAGSFSEVWKAAGATGTLMR